MKISEDRVIDIQESVQFIGHNKAKALIGLHGFTGCDTTGKFRKKGKLKWWQMFDKSQPKTVRAFILLGQSMSLNETSITALEDFVCQVYCPKYKGADLAETRWHLFRKSAKKIDLLPPTKGSFIQHLKRANFQCRIWRQADEAMQDIGDPVDHGWQKDEQGSYHAIGFDYPVAPNNIIELIKCGCKTGCVTDRCHCWKKQLSCTDMCECEDCDNRDNARFTIGSDDEDEENEEDDAL